MRLRMASAGLAWIALAASLMGCSDGGPRVCPGGGISSSANSPGAFAVTATTAAALALTSDCR